MGPGREAPWRRSVVGSVGNVGRRRATMRCDHRRVGLIAAVLVGLLAHGARADVTTEQGASILAFPKVIADGTRETVIQITNISNAMVHAHCFYVNGGVTFPDGPDGVPNT